MDTYEFDTYSENKDSAKRNGSDTSTETRVIQIKTSATDMSKNDNRNERRKILKNIILISVAFFFNFTSYMGLVQLQSSLHIDQGMGTTNQAVLYAAMMLSCLFIPKIAIKKLGHKWCIALSFLAYILWMGANGIGRWWSMTTTSVILGLAAAPLWTAQCSYLTLSATRYAKLTRVTLETVITRFFGIFFFFFQLSGLFGAIISSAILNLRNKNTTEPTEAALKFCGRNDCPWNNVTNVNLEKPGILVVWTMVGVYMGLACISVIIVAVFLDKLPNELDDKKTSTRVSQDIWQLLIATIKHLHYIPQILLIPMSMSYGFRHTYFNAEWNKSFISCGLGIWMVGYTTIPYGIVNACVCLVIGKLVNHINRILIFIFGALLDLSILITLYIWMPHPKAIAVVCIISALRGIPAAIWKTQLNALYGSIFTKDNEAAFSNYKMWESLGFIIAFAYSSALCTSLKTILLMCVLFIGMTGYLATEVYLRRTTQHSNKEDNSTEPQATSEMLSDHE